MRNSDYLRRDFSAIPPYVWVLALVVLLLASLACALWAAYALRLWPPAAGPIPTPIIWTATPAPTPLPTFTAVPTLAPTPTVPPDMAIGRYVRVTGTGGVGVSLRQEPDANSARLGIGYEGEVLVVLDGPRQAGGYVWWLLRDPEDAARQGWAVGDYLQPVEHP